MLRRASVRRESLVKKLCSDICVKMSSMKPWLLLFVVIYLCLVYDFYRISFPLFGRRGCFLVSMQNSESTVSGLRPGCVIVLCS